MARARSALSACGIDQELDRIADRVYADEHDERHHHEHESALAETADRERQHGRPSFAGLRSVASVYWSVRGVYL